MEPTCIDTSVLIELARGKLLRYIDPNRDQLYLTEITVYEYLRGMEVIGRDIEYAKIVLENLFKILRINNDVIKLASKFMVNYIGEGS